MLRYFTIVTILSMLVSSSSAASHFDTSFFKGFSDKDAKMLSGKLMPGIAFVSLKLNGQMLGEYAVKVVTTKKQGIMLQLTNTIVQQFHAKPKLLALLKKSGNRIGYTNIQYLTFHYDAQTQAINIQVPQAYLLNISDGSVAPINQWQFGVSGGDVSYNLNANHSSTDGINANNAFATLALKYNLGRWQFYSNWSGNIDQSTNSPTQMEQDFSYTYATTILPSIKSRLMFGYNSINSQLFGGGSFYGLTLNSQMNMLPQNQQTFKPVVQGVIQTPSTISLYQEGKLIYKKQLNPGPYRITDYNASSAMGDITEVITGVDGTKNTSVLPYQIISNALFQGVSQYALNMGYLENHDVLSPLFMEGEFRYGLNNYLTPYTGVFINKNYLSQGLGTTVNLGELGGVSVQTAYSILNPSQSVGANLSSKGMDAEITYYKSLDYIGTSFNVVGYLYETKGYRSLSDSQSLDLEENTHIKNQIQLSINQSVGDRAYLNGTINYQDNWDDSTTIDANLGVNYNWNQYVATDLNYNQSKVSSGDFSGQTNRTVSLTLQFNLGNSSLMDTSSYDDTARSLNNNLQYNYGSDSGKYNASASVVTSADYAQQSASHNSLQDSSFNGSLTTNANMADITVMASKQQNGYTAGGSISGGITYTPYTGFIFSNAVDNTFSVIDAGGVSGVSTGYNSVTDHNGYGISSDLMPYVYNSILLQDEQGQNGILLNHQVYAVPVEGAILYEKFASKVGSPLFILLLKAYQKDKGLSIKDKNSQSLAEHVYGGLYYVPTVKPGDTILVLNKSMKVLKSESVPEKLPKELKIT